jgi:hypothetical protein
MWEEDAISLLGCSLPGGSGDALPSLTPPRPTASSPAPLATVVALVGSGSGAVCGKDGGWDGDVPPARFLGRW